MNITSAFLYLVLTLILTSIFFVILNNSKGIVIPSLQSELRTDGYGYLVTSLAISLVIVLFFMLLKSSLK